LIVDTEELFFRVSGQEDENLTTWVFNDGFVPTAKLTSSGNYSIITDHLGTPVEAYDSDGNQVWSAELDIFGRVQEFTGEVDFIPFRFQGQYADPETGLYYNRFRYYDPDTGQYTQQDPIGLAGGNPTLYGYVKDTNTWIDVFGLGPGCGTSDRSAGNGASGSRTAEQAGISAGDAARIQNAANRTNQEIIVVGSRASGTSKLTSDWDYILSGNSVQRHSATSV
jgi:RHS repeat-associated protein